MIKSGSVPTHNLELWAKKNGRYFHVGTPVFNQPYAVCKGKKRAMEANSLAHFEFLKIVKNA